MQPALETQLLSAPSKYTHQELDFSLIDSGIGD